MSRTPRMNGKVPGFDNGHPLVIATDGSLIGKAGSIQGRKGDGGIGWIMTNGRWGTFHWMAEGRYQGGPVRTGDPSGPSKVLTLELRAVLLALKNGGPDADRLLVDSEAAISFLKQWQQGGEDMPDGYSLRVRLSGNPPRLLELARLMATLPELKIEKVKGHSGHLLNEAADSLARLAVRSPDDLRERAERLVHSFLVQWHEENRSDQ